MSNKLYTLILNPGFNQEFYDCTFRNGRTGPVGQRTKDRLEQAFGGLRWEEWTPPVAEAPAPKKRSRSKAKEFVYVPIEEAVEAKQPLPVEDETKD